MVDDLITNGSDENYFPVSPLHFVLMCIITLGFYHIFWSFKNWRFIRNRDQSNISPVWRSLFSPLWYFFLLRDINDTDKAGILRSTFFRLFLAFCYLLIYVLTAFPEFHYSLFYLSIVPLLPAVLAISNINKAKSVSILGISSRPSLIFTYLIGGLIFMLINGMLMLNI